MEDKKMLNEEELKKVNGGEIESSNVVGYKNEIVEKNNIHGGIIYNSSDPGFNKQLECMFGAPAIIE